MKSITRLARADEHSEIFKMGYDAWGEKKPLDEYLAGCLASKKYERGTWYVHDLGNGKIVSALIAYPMDHHPGVKTIGIGSIATTPGSRGLGFASKLIEDVLAQNADTEIFYLHSDIGRKFYERFDFHGLPKRHQLKEGSITMIRSSREIFDYICEDERYTPPAYF